MTDVQQILIVGGGITGLSAAAHIMDQAPAMGVDLRCTLLEAGPALGGPLKTVKTDGYQIEKGPESVFSNAAFDQLVQLLDLRDQVTEPASVPGISPTAVFHENRFIPLPDGLVMGIPTDPSAVKTTPLLSASGKQRVLAEPTIPPVKADRDISLGEFLRQRLGDELVDRLLEPLLAGPYAGNIDVLSLQALYPELRRVEETSGSLTEGLRKRRGPRGHGRPGSARPRVVSLKPGLGHLIERLETWLTPRINLIKQAAVENIEPSVQSRHRIDLAGGETLEADAVLVTAPADQTASMLKGAVPQAAEAAGAIDYASVVITAFVFDQQDWQEPFGGRTLLIPREKQRLTTTYTFHSNSWPHTCPAGKVLIRCHLGHWKQPPPVEASDRELADQALAEARTLLKLRRGAVPQLTRVFRWPHSLPQYTVGHRARVQKLNDALAPYETVAAAGAAYRGMGVPSCIADGQTQAQRLLDQLIDRE